MTEREERSKIAKETEREERNRIVKEMVEMVVKRTSPDYARGYRDGYAAAKEAILAHMAAWLKEGSNE